MLLFMNAWYRINNRIIAVSLSPWAICDTAPFAGKRRYNVRIWKLFNEVFDCLPFSAIVEEKILCVHAGLSPELQSLEQLRKIPRPTEIPDAGLLCDLLWSDPETDIRGWGESDRGVSFTFGEDVVTKFLARSDLDLICRAHQVVEDGYEFFARRQLVTVFSAPNYCGEFDNSGAMMSVDTNLMCSFQVLIKPSASTRAEAAAFSLRRASSCRELAVSIFCCAQVLKPADKKAKAKAGRQMLKSPK